MKYNIKPCLEIINRIHLDENLQKLTKHACMYPPSRTVEHNKGFGIFGFTNLISPLSFSLSIKDIIFGNNRHIQKHKPTLDSCCFHSHKTFFFLLKKR